MRDQLERLAARGAERRRREEERRARARRQPDPEERKRRAMAEGSVVGWASSLSLPLVAIFPFAGAIGVGALGLEGPWIFLGILLGLGSGAAAFFGVSALDHAYQRRWLAGLPFRIDIERYLEAFSYKAGFGARLIVTVRFVQAPDATEGKRLSDVAMGALRRSSATFAGGRELVITGPRRATAFIARGGMAYTNRRLHRWFRGCVRKALRPMDARCGIEEVEVRMEAAPT